MPPRGLPGNANLEQLKKGAKSFQRAVLAGDTGAAEVVREFHPRLAHAQPGSPELQRFTRADAQLVIARQFGFASWPKLKAHLDLVGRYARSPHEQPVGGPLSDERAIIDEFLRLACLTYGDDDPERLRRAQSLLDEHEWLAGASIHTIAATGDLVSARQLLERDPTQATVAGGPHEWEPLLYLTYARVPLAPGRSAVEVARLLLAHGADPNAGYLWEGLVPPFTALTGALGGGGTIPEHRERLALARLLLEAGADANDGQALYNEGADGREDWVDLLLEFGLGNGDGGPWRRLLGERQDSPRDMIEDLLMAAAGHGFTDRARKLLARGANPEGRGSHHPIYQGRSPVQEAALAGHMEIVSLLVEAGASWDHDDVDALLAAAMAGDRDTVARLLAADPGVRERAIERRPDQLVRAAGQDSYDAVALLIELGFDVNARARTAPLHEAAMRGNLPVIRLLLDHGADPSVHDTGYDATPAGWAAHHGQAEAQALLEAHARPGADAGPTGDAGSVRPASETGTAMRTVTAAFTAVSLGAFDDLAGLLSAEIDWHGLPDADGFVPGCHGRDQALERMQMGLLANGQVSVSAFVEEGDRVLAHVRPAGGTGEVGQWFVVAEVHDGQITRMSGYATEAEAHAALRAGPPAADADSASQRGEPTTSSEVAMTDPVLTLRPLTQADLPAIAAWFEDPDTLRFLGGPDWPAAMLANAERSIGTTFRGATQTGAHHYLALAAGTPVGYIDCGTFDRLTVYGGEGPDGPIIIEAIEAVTGSIAFVIDPNQRRQGLATAMIRTLTRDPDLAEVEVFEAGVDPDNLGARGALQAAGFRPRSTEPDDEGMLYYRARTARVKWRRSSLA